MQLLIVLLIAEKITVIGRALEWLIALFLLYIDKIPWNVGYYNYIRISNTHGKHIQHTYWRISRPRVDSMPHLKHSELFSYFRLYVICGQLRHLLVNNVSGPSHKTAERKKNKFLDICQIKYHFHLCEDSTLTSLRKKNIKKGSYTPWNRFLGGFCSPRIAFFFFFQFYLLSSYGKSLIIY